MNILSKLKKLPPWAYAVLGVGLGAVLFLSKPRGHTGQIAVVGPDMEEQSTKITDMEGRIGGVESGLSSAIYQIERNNELLNDSFTKLNESLLTGLGNYGSGTGPTAGYNAGDTGLAAGEPPGASTASVLSESIDLLKSYGKMYNETKDETWHQRANKVRADLADMGLADQLPPELRGRTKNHYDMPGSDTPRAPQATSKTNVANKPASTANKPVPTGTSTMGKAVKAASAAVAKAKATVASKKK